jgi:hypothetical protein
MCWSKHHTAILTYVHTTNPLIIRGVPELKTINRLTERTSQSPSYMYRTHSMNCPGLQLQCWKIIAFLTHLYTLYRPIFADRGMLSNKRLQQRTPWGTALFQKLNVACQTRSSIAVFTRVCIGPYPEPDESRPHIYTYFLKIHFNIIISGMTRFPFRFSG